MASSSRQPLQARDTARERRTDEHRHGGRGGTRRRVTGIEQRDYADTVSFYSQLAVPRSLYTGSHFDSLATYLQLPFGAKAPDLVPKTPLPDEDGASFNFVTFYDLDPASDQRMEHLSSPQEFEAKAKLLEGSAHGRLIFMRGCPTPEWLLVIGASYQVDPEFFRRHLDFRQGIRTHYSQPSLPSTLATAVRLQMTTIGASAAKTKTDSEQATLEALREENQAQLKRYHESQRNLAGMKFGSPIVRDCAIFDLQHFCITQDISLYANECGKGGWFALIWLDASTGLKAGPTAWVASPLRTGSWTVSSVPVVQHRQGLALRSKARLLVVPEDNGNRSVESTVQSACFLHDIFQFAASSENQFLNMLEAKLLDELEHSRLVQQTNPTLSNLLYSQQVLDRHIQRIRDGMATFRAPHALDWPHAATRPEKQQKADEALWNLARDYEYLLARALTLSEQCGRGMQVVMNNAVIKESREAMAQAAGVAKLTRLAFIFVPLSFTASFFGMNLVQIVDGNLPLWIWFAVSSPILFISILFMDYDVLSSVWKLLTAGREAMTKTETKEKVLESGKSA